MEKGIVLRFFADALPGMPVYAIFRNVSLPL